jgi:hypothetical protein
MEKEPKIINVYQRDVIKRGRRYGDVYITVVEYLDVTDRKKCTLVPFCDGVLIIEKNHALYVIDKNRKRHRLKIDE